MRTVANDIVDNLINKLPILIDNVDLRKANNKTYNAVRIIRKTLKRLKSIKERDENNKRKMNRASDLWDTIKHTNISI